MKKKVFSLFFTLTLAVSLILIAPPNVLAGSAIANADVAPLAVDINGSSNTEKVFFVGATLNLTGHVHSLAEITAAGEYVGAGLYWTLSLTGPGVPAGTYAEGRSEDEGYDDAGVEANETISLIYTVTQPGQYTVHLQSSAYASSDDSGLYDSDNANIQLSYMVASQSGEGRRAHFYGAVRTGTALTWTEAESAAANLAPYTPPGSRITFYPHLVSITSQEEQAFVEGLADVDRKLWVGGTDAAKEGVWKWSTGERLGKYTNWGQWQPSVGTGENYMMWDGSVSYVWKARTVSGLWEAYGYIVEYEARAR